MREKDSIPALEKPTKIKIKSIQIISYQFVKSTFSYFSLASSKFESLRVSEMSWESSKESTGQSF